MTKRVRVRQGGSLLTPVAYWRLLDWSPAVMLVGMAAGGVLFVRSILVWGVQDADHLYGPDIPISAAVLLVWAATTALLLIPPRDVLALPSSSFESSRLLVWPLGRRFRLWTMLAAPVGGLLAAMAPIAVATCLGLNPETPYNPWIGIPSALLVAALAIGFTGLVLRSALHGVELTPTHLIARGYLWTRRYPRNEIVSVNAVELSFWPNALLHMITNRDVDSTVQVSLSSGHEPLLLASNSNEADVCAGADIIRSWRAAIID